MSKILFLSGWGYPASVFSDLKEQLQPEHHLTVIDQVDLEAEDQSGSKEVCYFPYARNLTEIIRREKPDLVAAWSMGGIILLEALAAGKLPPFEVLLIGATPRFVQQNPQSLAGVKEKFLRAMSLKLKQQPEQVLNDFHKLAAHPDKPEQVAEISREMLRDEEGELLRGLVYLHRINLIEDLPKINRFLTVVHAEKDRIVPPAAAQYLVEQLSNAALNFVSGGHAFPLTRSDQFVELLDDWASEGEVK